MSNENLNLDFHVKRLTLKALNRYHLRKDAAEALGINERTLYRYRHQYDIIFDKATKRFISNQKD